MVFACPICNVPIVTKLAYVIGIGAAIDHENEQGGRHHVVDRETHVRGIFTSYDVDQSGTVDRSELEAMLLDLHFPADRVEKCFADADENQDGVLQFEEFVG